MRIGIEREIVEFKKVAISVRTDGGKSGGIEFTSCSSGSPTIDADSFRTEYNAEFWWVLLAQSASLIDQSDCSSIKGKRIREEIWELPHIFVSPETRDARAGQSSDGFEISGDDVFCGYKDAITITESATILMPPTGVTDNGCGRATGGFVSFTFGGEILGSLFEALGTTFKIIGFQRSFDNTLQVLARNVGSEPADFS